MKNQKGFTLIELAIVLVIIGIILGAVIKGQDLIQNARAKKVAAKFKEWEIAQWTFYDRKGRFAGDGDADGLIETSTTDSGDTDTVEADFNSANFIKLPPNPISVGSYNFYVFFGVDGVSDKNIMIVCKSSDCNTAFTSDELVYIDAIDVSVDGTADGSAGLVQCTTTKPDTALSSTNWEGDYSSSSTRSFSACSTSTKALVYYFDSNAP